MKSKKEQKLKEVKESLGYSKEPKQIPYERRDFIKSMGLVMGGIAAIGISTKIMANEKKGIVYMLPEDKKLSENWIKSLYERGNPEVYSGKELAYIGMPIGGVTAGQVYLGGDGKLWLWHIFNDQHNGVVEKIIRFNGERLESRNGSNYVVPVEQQSPIEQGFEISLKTDGKQIVRKLDKRGFKDITFKGQYPIANTSYRDEKLPIEIDLLSFSPFIPLDWDASGYPATVAKYTVRNISDKEVTCTLSGWLENGIHIYTGDALDTKLRNRLLTKGNDALIVLDAPANLATSNTISFNPAQQRDHGSMAILMRDADATSTFSLSGEEEHAIGDINASKELIDVLNNRGVGRLSKTMTLKAGEEKAVEFVISWYFPNMYPKEGRDMSNQWKGRYYKNLFEDATAVALDLSSKYKELERKTLLWVENFYENSTLPHWFLNRTFINTSILATETSHRLEDGRFWGWEGIGCCPGTCTHVWHYGQAMGRIFPEMERNLREKTDFKIINRKTGQIDFRGGFRDKGAADGQAGIVMRAYRDHQMSKDSAYLQKNWSDIKLTLQYLIDKDKEDGEANGMIFGEQHNTLDAEWYGNIPVITSLYLSALACAYEMAKEMGDKSSKKKYKTILEKGKKNIEKLFNKDYGYFVQNEDPKHSDAIGVGPGCYIDQVFGQSWAFQVGLGRLFNEDMNKQALQSLWKHNFVIDMGLYRAQFPPHLAGRPYALDGESGLVICTWPNGGKKDNWEKYWTYRYFNECMTGFEYQAASHMVWEASDGLLEKGLAITKAVHDRYHPLRRNPYNEIECSDHYARAMASYGVYIAACGFEYHGPKGYIAFGPRWQRENFKAAFTSAEGWGSFYQRIDDGVFYAGLTMSHGKLSLKEIALDMTKKVMNGVVLFNGKKIITKQNQTSKKLHFLMNTLTLKEGDKLDIQCDY